MKNNKGFTLIELLAVITIMGILIVVAIISASKITDLTRKNIYINNAITFIDSTRTEQVDNNENVVYVYRLSDLNVSNNDKSPYAKFQWGYVISVCESSTCKYYYMSLDKAGNIIGETIDDQQNNVTYISPIPVEVIEEEKGKIIIKLPSEYTKVNIFETVVNNTLESKLSIIYNQLEKAYTNNNSYFSFAIGNETQYKVYTINKYDDIRFIAKENENPQKVGSGFRVKLKYTMPNFDRVPATEEYHSFTVLEDRGDTIVAVETREHYGTDKRDNWLYSIKNKIAGIKLNNLNSEGISKIKEIRLLETNDLKVYLPNISELVENENMFPYSIVRKLNINNPNTIPNWMGTSFKLSISEDDYTVIVDSSKEAYYEKISFSEKETTIKIPKSWDDCRMIKTNVASASTSNYIIKVPSTNFNFRYKLVFEFDKEAIKDEI